MGGVTSLDKLERLIQEELRRREQSAPFLQNKHSEPNTDTNIGEVPEISNEVALEALDALRSIQAPKDDLIPEINPEELKGVGKFIYNASAPLRWAADTSVGKFLQNISAGAGSTMFRDPEYFQTRNPITSGTDQLAQTAGSVLGNVYLMSQAGLVGSELGGMAALGGLSSPIAQSAIRGLGTAATAHGLQTLSAPEENRPTAKDFGQRASWLLASGLLTPTATSVYDQWAGKTGFNKLLFNPAVRAGLISTPVGAAGSVASQAISGFSETENFGEFLKKTGVDALTYGGFNALMQVPGIFSNQKAMEAQGVYQRASNAMQRYITAASQTTEDGKLNANVDEMRRAIVEYGRAVNEAYPLYMRVAPAGTRLTPSEYLRGNLAENISPLAADIPLSLSPEKAIEFFSELMWSVGATQNMDFGSRSGSARPTGAVAIDTTATQGAVQPPQTIPAQPTPAESVQAGGTTLPTVLQNFVTSFRDYKKTSDGEVQQQLSPVIADLANNLRLALSDKDIPREDMEQFYSEADKLGITPAELAGMFDEVDSGSLKGQTPDVPEVEQALLEVDPEAYRREVVELNNLFNSLNLTNEEKSAIWKNVSGKESSQKGTASDFSRVKSLLANTTNVKELTEYLTNEAKGDAPVTPQEGTGEEQSSEVVQLPTEVPESPDGISPGTIISDIHGGDFEVVVERENNYLVRDEGGRERQLPKSMVRIKTSDPVLDENETSPDIPEEEPPSDSEITPEATEMPIVAAETSQADETIPTEESVVEAPNLDEVLEQLSQEETVALTRDSLIDWSESDEAKETSKQPELTTRHLFDQDIERVIKNIESGKETISGALAIYDKVADLLDHPEDTRIMHRDRLSKAKEYTGPAEREEINPRGREAKSYTPKNIEVTTRFEVVSQNDLLTSDSEGYDRDLQNRIRHKPEDRRSTISSIKSKFNPERLAESAETGNGAPITNRKLNVESGNARAMAIRELKDEGSPKYEEYKQWLVKNAERFGLDPEEVAQIEDPILIRVRTSDVDDVGEYIQDSNDPTVTELTAAEQAINDVRRLSKETMNKLVVTEAGGFDGRENHDFRTAFFDEVVGPTGRGQYFTDGLLNKKGTERIRNALLAKAYGENYELLESVIESEHDNIKKISGALVDTSGAVADMKEGSEQGYYHELDISYELAAAASRMAYLRANRIPIEEYLVQYSLPGLDSLGELSRLLLVKLDQFGGGRQGSKKKVSTFINNYVSLVRANGHPDQMQMPGFETEVPDRATLIEAASTDKAMGLENKQVKLDLEGGGSDEQAIQEHAEGGPEEGSTASESIASYEVEGEGTEELATKQREIGERYELTETIEKGVQGGSTDTLALAMNAIEEVSNLGEEYDISGYIADQLELLFSDNPEESDFNDVSLDTVRGWLDNYKRLVEEAEAEGVKIPKEEAWQAAKNKLRMNLQLFGKRDGNEAEKEWEHFFEKIRSQGDQTGGGVDLTQPVEGTPDVSEGTTREAETKPIGELVEKIGTPNNLKREIKKALEEEASGLVISEELSDYPEDLIPPEEEYDSPYGVLLSENAGTVMVEHRRGWQDKNPVEYEDVEVEEWIKKREERKERIKEGIPKQKVTVPYTNKELRFVETPGLKYDVKNLEKPVKITQWAMGLPTPDLVGNTVSILGSRAKTVYNSVNKSMQAEIDKHRKKWTPEEMQEANEILEGKKPISGKFEESVVFIRSIFDEYRKAFGIEGYIPNYLPHKAGDTLEEMLARQDELLEALGLNEIPGALNFFAKHKRTNPEGKLMFDDPFDALSYWFHRGIKAAATEDVLVAIEEAKAIADPSRRKFLDEYGRVVLGMPGAEERFWNNAVAEIVETFTGKPYSGRHIQRAIGKGVSAWYDSNLMGNPGLPIKNIGQQMLTVAMLSDGHPTRGFKHWARGVRLYNTELGKELLQYSEIGQDRQFLANIDRDTDTKGFLQRVYDPLAKQLWRFYKWSDNVNVGVSFLAGVDKALESGLSIEQAIRYGDTVAANTQYSYGTNGLMMFKGPVGRILGMVNSWSLYWTRLNLAMIEGVGNLPRGVKNEMAAKLGNLKGTLQDMDEEFKKLASNYSSQGQPSGMDFSYQDWLENEGSKTITIGKGSKSFKMSAFGIAAVAQMWIGMYLTSMLRKKVTGVETDDTTPIGVLKGHMVGKMLTSKDVSPGHTILKSFLEIGSDGLKSVPENTKEWFYATVDSFIPAKKLRHEVKSLYDSVMNEYWKEDGIHNQLYQTTFGEEMRAFIGRPVERNERRDLTKTFQKVYTDHFDIKEGKVVSSSAFTKAKHEAMRYALNELGYTKEGVEKIEKSANTGVRSSAYKKLWTAIEANDRDTAYSAAMILRGAGVNLSGITASAKSNNVSASDLAKARDLFHITGRYYK